jgi:hypothetical protein
MDIIYLEGQIEQDSTLTVRFQKPIFIKELVVLSVTTNSEPFLIPKAVYSFKIGNAAVGFVTITSDESYFPALVDLLKNIQKKEKDLSLFLEEFEDRQTIVAIFRNQTVDVLVSKNLGFIFGANEVNDEGLCYFSCLNEKVRYLLLKPVTPGVVNINLLETFRTNIQTKSQYGKGSLPKFRIGTIPANDQAIHYKTFSNLEHKFELGEAIQVFRLEITWSDGVPYIPRNQNIAINIAYA